MRKWKLLQGYISSEKRNLGLIRLTPNPSSFYAFIITVKKCFYLLCNGLVIVYNKFKELGVDLREHFGTVFSFFLI